MLIGITYRYKSIVKISDSYDSKVSEEDGEKNDYSIITSVGWDF